MTTQLQRAELICDALQKMLGLDTAVPVMKPTAKDSPEAFVKMADKIIVIVMSWTDSEGDLIVARCPISRRALALTDNNLNMRTEILKTCITVWRAELRAAMIEYAIS